MKNPDPGYLLPDGDAYTDDFVCQLIYIPRKDEYYRAILGAILYMGTWTAWERDSEKRGKDAAQAWREANELTLECWRMTCMGDITDRLDLLVDLLALKKDCCDDNITYGPQTEVETEIVPLAGDPPEYYGETEVDDWDDWAEHVCYNAHVYVDILVQRAGDIDSATRAAAITIGVIAAALAALSFVGLGLAVAYGLATLTAGEIIAVLTEGLFSDTAENFETARDDIVCALLNGDSLADAVEGALSSGLDWDLLFQFVDYDSATAIIYEGGHEQGYLSPELRSDCDCVPTVPEGASSYPIDILSVSSPTVPGAGWTLHDLTTDGTNMFIDVTKETSSGQYLFVDLLVAPSPYWGVSGVSHRGIVYHGVRYTHASGRGHWCEPGFLHEASAVGEANYADRWYLMCGSPYAGYDDDLAAYMGISFYYESGTRGLNQNPDQNRTIRVAYWAKDIGQPNYRFQCYVSDLHWAINKT